MDILSDIRLMVSNRQYRPIQPPRAVQHNDLIEACYSMTLTEKRMLLLAISKIFSPGAPEYGDTRYCYRAAEWKKIFNIQHNHAYDDIKESALTLLKRQVHIRDGSTTGIHFNWFSSVKYFDTEGTIQMSFTPEAMVYLCELEKLFTSVDLLHIADLQSFYAIRLYELLMKWKATGFRTDTVDDFRAIMECTDQYPKFSAFKRRVIDPAIKELNKNSDIDVKLTVEYSGRTAKKLNFSFQQKRQARLALVVDDATPEQSQRTSETIQSEGLEQIRNILKEQFTP